MCLHRHILHPYLEQTETYEGPPTKRARNMSCSSERSLSPSNPAGNEDSSLAEHQNGSSTCRGQQKKTQLMHAETYTEEPPTERARNISPFQLSSQSCIPSSNPAGHQDSAYESSAEHRDSTSTYQMKFYPRPTHFYPPWGSSYSEDNDSSTFSRTASLYVSYWEFTAGTEGSGPEHELPDTGTEGSGPEHELPDTGNDGLYGFFYSGNQRPDEAPSVEEEKGYLLLFSCIYFWYSLISKLRKF